MMNFRFIYILIPYNLKAQIVGRVAVEPAPFKGAGPTEDEIQKAWQHLRSSELLQMYNFVEIGYFRNEDVTPLTARRIMDAALRGARQSRWHTLQHMKEEKE